MSLSINIQKKQKDIEKRKYNQPSDIYNLKEVQEIKDAVQEHLLFVGMDNANNVKNISLIGIGTSRIINLNAKYIVRTALVTDSAKVILVHNHPSNELNPSNEDKKMTNELSRLLRAFNIELIDHVIVGENEYVSMGHLNLIKQDYKSEKTLTVENAMLIEENENLKLIVDKLNNEIEKSKNKEFEDEYG